MPELIPDLDPVLDVRSFSVSVGKRLILKDVSLTVQERQVLGIVGPSGAGKSTFLRGLNRMLDLDSQYSCRGEVRLRGEDIYDSRVNANALRERIGMIFQQPVVFPKNIRDNVLFGFSGLRKSNRHEREEVLEKALRQASLWDEVKDRLKESALHLSIGQQQRLCIARALTLNPEILLMDEPTSALDPRAAGAIEDLIHELKQERTIVIVTHNLEQSRRVTDWVACICADSGCGELLESACCDAFFSSDACQRVFHHMDDGEEKPTVIQGDGRVNLPEVTN